MRLGALALALLPACGAANDADRDPPKDEVPYAPLAKKLSPSDPAAQLDPALLAYKPAAFPQGGSPGEAVPIGYHVKSGKAQVIPETAGLPTQLLREGSVGFAESPSGQKEVTGAETDSVIGTDTRTPITDTGSYPWRAMVKLYTTYPDNGGSQCSGAMIGAKYVLTAAHCIFSRGNGGWARSVQVIPGLNGSYQPYGAANVTYMRSYTGWTVNQDQRHDFALLTLDRPIGNTVGWIGFGFWPSIVGVTGHLAAYDVGRWNGQTLLYRYGPIGIENEQQMFYNLDTEGGSSGGSVYRIVNGSRFSMGVNTNHAINTNLGPMNYGVRIDQTKFNSLNAWMATGF